METLIRKRASIKGKITIFEKYLANLESKYPDHVVVDKNCLLEIELRYESFLSELEHYDRIQEEIDIIVQDLDNEIKIREAISSAFYAACAKAKSFAPPDTLVPPCPQSTCSNFNDQGQNINNIKLPTIHLKKFGGNFESWLEFRDVFTSLIHANTTISNVQKFHYLRASLEGSAAEIIRSLEFCDANYDTAWSLLCSRFNNERILVNNHVSSLFNLDHIKEESSDCIRKLLDNVTKHLRALETLKEPTSSWDTLIIHLVVKKLDSVTSREYEEFRSKTSSKPTLEDLKTFLSDRADLLETIERSKLVKKSVIKTKYESKTKSFVTPVSTLKCSFCKKEHFISNCDEFLKISVNDRYDYAKKNNLCVNCLRFGHGVAKCRSSSCKHCKGRHSSLLHFNRKPQSSIEPVIENSVSHASIDSDTHNVLSHMSAVNSQIILGTAVVKVFDKFNKTHFVRSLLDSGSQSSFITKEICDKLKLEVQEISTIKVCGLNKGIITNISQKLDLVIQSTINGYTKTLSCLVVSQITSSLPNTKFNVKSLDIPNNISMADPNMNIPGKIDILLGADCFWELMCVGQIKLGQNGPTLQKTKLGWILAGPVSSENNTTINCNLNIDRSLSRFWELEEIPGNLPLSKNDKLVESHFLNTFKRDSEGRFIVTIPLKNNLENLADTFEIAKRRFFNLENKFKGNNDFKHKYFDFIREYIQLNHMRKVDTTLEHSSYSYYLPHHGVLKESSLTTKLRVVFDGSASNNSGLSLNNLQLVGPTIQQDLLSILLRFRKHNFVIGSDIEKMYRMVLVNPEQTPLQKILFRFNEDDPLDTYELLTVTYGTASASYLAIRSLYQLGIEQELINPKISEVIKDDFYVDDMLSGSNTIEDAIYIANEVSKVLSSGCFNLRKWVSNNQEVLEGIKSNDTSNSIDFGNNENTKTLGLIWNSNSDSLMFKINPSSVSQITKRSVLSETSQIFDPLGLLSPCTILAKIMMQELWSAKLTWDESLPSTLHTKWLSLRNELTILNDIKIDRQITCKNPKYWEIHGFSDASQKAYGACVYIKSICNDDNVYIKLVCAKSKVSPIKPVTIPRLELLAAQLLAKTMRKVKESLKISQVNTFYWTDSTIVLGWLKMDPNQLQTFVANRVANIQELTDVDSWGYVPTRQNPTDCVSRGVMPNLLQNLDLYWHGPEWLKSDIDCWPRLPFSKSQDIPELKKNVLCCKNQTLENNEIFNRYSQFTRLIRVFAYICRFKNNCSLVKESRNLGTLSLKEIDVSLKCLIKLCQSETFNNEINSIAKGKLNSKNALSKLNPFIDDDGILRCGGRLANSHFEYSKKFPILLSSKHMFTRLLFKYYHAILLHAGPQLLLSSIRDKYWPLSGRNLARKTVRECTRCFRVNPQLTHPIMGQLPEKRLTPAPAFYTTGCDYAGPFLLKNKRGRGATVSKCYISLFVCFTTRAIHLELVSDLTSEAFIASLRRFVARRGKPLQIFSDNGTNYTGANSELHKLGQFLKVNDNKLTDEIQSQGISWSFIPAHSPHFGGLWEAGVKSVKYHLRRVAGKASLTFEQFYTLLTQIEATLNSRPLSPLSSDPSDLVPLTPSHFLIGRAITSVPDPDLSKIPENRLSHFQRVQQLHQHFWKRWSREYVSELQERHKWKSNQGSLKTNDLVLIKDDNLPPLKWSLGRIVELIHGKDSLARVALIKTKAGIVKRSFSKICPLPVNSD